MNNFLESINLPIDVIVQYGMVIVGVLFAIVAASVVSGLFGRGVNKATFIKTVFMKVGVSLDMELIGKVVSKAVYFIIIFIGFVGVLKYLNIEIKLVNDILDTFLPKILNAGGLAIIAWFLATIAKAAIIKGYKTMKLDKTIGSDTHISESVGVIAYWSIIVLFLPQILEKLGQNELLRPITNIIDSITSYIPNIIGAAIIFIIGLFIAKILKQITVSVLKSFHIDKASERIGLSHFSISNLTGTVVYILILLPVAIQALEKLKIEVISGPATQMLQTMINMIPLLFTAGIIMIISYFIGKFVSKLISELLSGVGFDKVLDLIGLKNVDSSTKPSEMIGILAFTYILLLATVEASNAIGFQNIASIVNQFISFATNILVGIVILGLGLFLANLATKAIKSTSSSKILPTITKIAIIVLTSFMGLQQMGIGGDIINQAFTLLLGAAAVAFALAVGLGSKEIAGEEVRKIIANMKK